jgi:hypothetical protein
MSTLAEASRRLRSAKESAIRRLVAADNHRPVDWSRRRWGRMAGVPESNIRMALAAEGISTGKLDQLLATAQQWMRADGVTPRTQE